MLPEISKVSGITGSGSTSQKSLHSSYEALQISMKRDLFIKIVSFLLLSTCFPRQLLSGGSTVLEKTYHASLVSGRALSVGLIQVFVDEKLPA